MLVMQGINVNQSNTTKAGFTLVELVVAITVMAIIAVGLFAVLIQTYSSSSYGATQVTIASNAQLAMDQIEQDVRYSDNFDTQLVSPFSDPYGPTNNSSSPQSWTFAGTPSSSTNRALIIEANATTSNPQANTRTYVYKTGTYSCSQEIYNPPLHYTKIYFVYNNTLYRRTITDTTTSTCNPSTEKQVQKQSCPEASVGSWPSICKANDEVIATNVTAFSVDYYYGTGTSALNVYPTDSGNLVPTADSAQVTLTIGDGKSNHTTTTISLKIKRV